MLKILVLALVIACGCDAACIQGNYSGDMFNPADFLGIWKEVKVWNVRQGLSKCGQHTFIGDGSKFTYEYSWERRWLFNTKKSWKFDLIFDLAPGKFQFIYHELIKNKAYSANVLTTDFTNYAVVATCIPGNVYGESTTIRILVRDTSYNIDQVKDKIEDSLKPFGQTLDKFQNVIQTGC